jgi:PKD repeat protein
MNPTHAYASNGSYTVTLIATNAAGCSDTTTFNVSITVGVEEISTITALNLFPNPANNEANIEISISSNAIISLQMYDINGKVVISSSVTELNQGQNKISIDLSAVPAGIYYVQITSESFNKIAKLAVIK